MSAEAFIAGASAAVALISAVIALWAVREQRTLARYTTGYTYISNAERMLEVHPQLLELHGITMQELEALEMQPVELIYLIHSFTGGDLYHRIEGKGVAALTQYRMALLAHPKVQRAWTRFIRSRFVDDGPFSQAIENYLSRQASVVRTPAEPRELTGKPG